MKRTTRIIITTIFILTAVLAGYASVAQAMGYVPPQIACTIQACPIFGVSPLKVDFIANVTIGTAETYNWDFGDGITSYLKETTHTYINPGNYTVKLTVTDRNGAKATHSKIITVLEPIADTGIALTATASGYHSVSVPSNAVDNKVYTTWVAPYNFDRTAIKWLTLDCGSVHELSSISIWWGSRSRVANYDIQISDDGQVWTNCYTGLSAVNFQITPYITAYPLSGKARFVRIYIKEVFYSWFFAASVYEVYIYGELADSNQAPSASASANLTTIVTGQDVQFTGSGTDTDGIVTSYSWDFGDGVQSSSQNPSHTYINKGIYNITLTVTDDDGATGSDSVTITVNEPPNQPPTASATANPTTIEVGQSVQFTGGGTDSDGTIASYSWNFGDGATSTAQNPAHTYINSGNYNITLTVTDDDGATGSDSVTITVNELPNQPPVATANAAPIAGEAPLEVIFTGSGSDPDGTITGYGWAFGDGQTSSEQNPSYTYDKPGNYTATLTTTDDHGATGTDSISITVAEHINQPPTAAAAASPASGDVPLTVQFTATASDADGTIASYSWVFGDGHTSATQNPLYTYNAAGTYTAALTVTDDNGATAVDSVTITVNEGSGGPIEVVFQEGTNGYMGCIDSWLYEKNGYNYGTSTSLQITDYEANSGYDRKGVLKFDISSLGDNITITAARIELYVYDSLRNSDAYCYMHLLKKPWTEEEVTWNSCDGTNAWQVGGAEGVDDVGMLFEDLLYIPWNPDGWYTWEFNAVSLAWLESWARDDSTNYGVLFSSYTANTKGTHVAWSSEYSDISKRPKLTITYYRNINQPPTGSVEINNGAASTDSQEVTLTLSAQDTESSVAQMQFSNDGVNWTGPEAYSTTKAWVLSAGDGEKTVYAKFKDDTGNWSDAASDSIVLDTATLVGPDGGVVFSPDGRIKLIIPPGALSELTPVSIQTADSVTFDQSDMPIDHELAIAGEFNPVGLNFNVPAQVIFYLDNPAIPGTPVSLYLYHKLEGTFVSTGKTSNIAADGITVSFSIDHFSTYGALQNMVSTGGPIGGGVNIPTPDLFTGAYTHDIAIEIPKGRKDMHPNLSLQYRSGNPNSWVGQGWQLNPGYIQRSTKQGVPKYDDQEDTFIFVSQSQSTELVHLIDNLYQAKVEGGFIKYYKENDDSWYLLTKDGNKMYFGQDLHSKQTTSKGSFAWYLTRAVDPNGNYVEFSYIKDAGKVYLDSISYTGPYPKYEVRFYLEDRADKHSSYISGEECIIEKRLDYIEVYCDSEKVWTYTIEYEASPDTDRSLLKSITQKGSDGTSYPAKTFEYQVRQ